MWKQAFKHAGRTSWKKWGEPIVVMLIGATIAFPLYWLLQGRDVAFDEALTVTIALAGSLAGLIAVFAYNLACAPYRIVRDERNQLKDELSAHIITDADYTPLFDRKEFSLALIASLMSSNDREQTQFLEMLREDVLYERVKIASSSSMLTMHLRYLRQGVGGIGPNDQRVPDTVLIERGELADYFSRSGVEIPQWLRDTATETQLRTCPG